MFVQGTKVFVSEALCFSESKMALGTRANPRDEEESSIEHNDYQPEVTTAGNINEDQALDNEEVTAVTGSGEPVTLEQAQRTIDDAVQDIAYDKPPVNSAPALETKAIHDTLAKIEESLSALAEGMAHQVESEGSEERRRRRP